MTGQNLEFLNVNAHTAVSVAGLRERNLIKRGSPNWWSTDYAPDPREYVSFEEFNSRLVDVGDGCRLYPHPRVPMTLLKLEIDGENLSFMVTARPYHERETTNHSMPNDLFWEKGDNFSISTVRPLSEIYGKMRSLLNPRFGFPELPSQCLPHIRGMFIEARGANLFWSTVYSGRKRNVDFRDVIQDKLASVGLGHIHARDFIGYSDFMTRTRAHKEAYEKRIITGKQYKGEINHAEVSRVEFCDDMDASMEKGRAVLYPVRLPGLKATLPVLVSTRNCEGKTVERPVALGIEAESGVDGRGYGLWFFGGEDTCRAISRVLSKDFDTQVDVMLRRPLPGRPAYEYLGPN